MTVRAPAQRPAAAPEGPPEGDACELFCYNADLVARLRREVAGVGAVAALFRLLGDETRCTIVAALDRAGELCVCDLAHVTGLSVATVSHHLRKLREQGILAFRRQGKLVFHYLTDDRVGRLLQETGWAAGTGGPALVGARAGEEARR